VKVEPQLYGDRKVYTVSAFNRGVASWLTRLPSVWVEGEVTEFRRQPGWQAVFFTLKDPGDGACLPVTMPRNGFDALRLDLIDGMTVHVFGRPELYGARGVFQLRALTIEPLGLGAVLAGLERLKRKLAAEGLFAADRKRALPLFPRRIGLLTGNEAAAKRDFLTAVAARFPAASVVVAQTYVQGPQAAGAIASTLAELARAPEVDVVVVARGGGAIEDLWAFNHEAVARAIAAVSVPVVSAIGHETDFTIADFVADVRAPTPSAAAELMVPDGAALAETLDDLRARAERAVKAQLWVAQTDLGGLEGRLRRAFAAGLARAEGRLAAAAARLEGLSPRRVLERGYAVLRQSPGGAIVRRAGQVGPGDELTVLLGEGSLTVTVRDTRPEA
jgi:exodeoxyribonuclease VII large subunit